MATETDMPIEVQCPCGKTLNVGDDLAGRRVKCPVCGEILSVPDNRDVADSGHEEEYDAVDDAPPVPRRTRERSRQHSGRVPSVSGKPATGLLGLVVPGTFGSTTLSLEDSRVIEETRKPLIRRHTELRLARVESVAISTSRDPRLFVLGLATVPAYGIGIVVLLVWIIRRFRWLSICSDSTSLVVRIQGPDDPYEDFMDAVLDASDAADSGRSSESD